MRQSISHLAKQTIWRSKFPGIIEFHSLLNLLPGAAVIVDRQEGNILIGNIEFLKISAYSQNELVGSSITQVFPEFRSPGATESCAVSLVMQKQDKGVIPVRAHVIPIDGDLFSIISLDNQISSLANETDYQSKIIKGMIQLISVRESDNIEIALKTSAAIIREMLGTTSCCIYQADSRIPQLLKIAADENGITFPDILSSTDLIRLPTASIWMPGKRIITDIHRFGRANNLSYVASVPLGHKGALVGMLVAGHSEANPDEMMGSMLELIAGQINQIMEYYILTSNLVQGDDKYQKLITTRETLIDHSMEGIVILDNELKVNRLNPAAENMLGYASIEIAGQPVENTLIGPEGLIPALEAARAGIPTHDMGNEYLHKRDGQSFPVIIRVFPVQSGNDILGILIFINDVSEHEQIRVRTQQLENRAFLGELTQVFAHEVRNPINSISLGLQLLAGQIPSDDPAQSVIVNVQSDCTKLISLMESILAFSRQTYQKFESVDLNILLRRILDRWRPRLTNTHVELFYHSEEQKSLVMGDKRALEQVFINLISNSVEAMSNSGGTLAVQLRRNVEVTAHLQMEVTISDTGPGIPDDIKDRVFEPFVSTKSRGTGIGLAITKQIITAHKGSIQVNTFPGGTVFHIYLPAIQS